MSAKETLPEVILWLIHLPLEARRAISRVHARSLHTADKTTCTFPGTTMSLPTSRCQPLPVLNSLSASPPRYPAAPLRPASLTGFYFAFSQPQPCIFLTCKFTPRLSYTLAVAHPGAGTASNIDPCEKQAWKHPTLAMAIQGVARPHILNPA